MEQSGRKPLELYLHIPFCASKCKYCDFRSAPASGAARHAYVKDLCRKIRSHGDLAEVSLVVSIFLGGGTPSILEAEETGQIFQAIRETFSLAEDVEITTEMNPGTVSREKLKIYRNLGINRLSIGLQSMDDRELAMLGRIHTRQDFLDAVDRIIGGLERKDKLITPEEKRSIAHHEAGHATVSWMLPYANPLFKVTIVPRGQSLGAAWYLPEERQLVTREQMYDEMCSLIGGRVAEEIVNGQPSTGALNDLERLTKMAYAMVTYYGMSEKVGTVSFYDSTGSRGFELGKPYSEKTAELIDKEVKSLIEFIHDRTRKILEDNKDGFLAIAALLLEKEVIFADDLERILGPRKGTKVSEDPEETAAAGGKESADDAGKAQAESEPVADAMPDGDGMAAEGKQE